MQVKSTLRKVTGVNDLINDVATNGSHNNVKTSAKLEPEEEIQTLKKMLEQQQNIISKLLQQLAVLIEQVILQNQDVGKGSAQWQITNAAGEFEAALKWAQTLIAAMQHISNRLDANEKRSKN